MKSGGKMRAPLMACLTSILTTAFTVTTITYDVDTSPRKRTMNGEFYGFIPDKTSHRTASFLSMMALSTVHMGWRTVSSAILMLINWKYLFYYLGGEILMYLGICAARNDFVIWVPLSGPAVYVCSFAKRFLLKIGTDFTLCAHFRHPYEIGAPQWC